MNYRDLSLAELRSVCNKIGPRCRPKRRPRRGRGPTPEQVAAVAASRLNVDVKTARRLIRNGELPWEMVRQFRLCATALERLLEL
jgi:excisionase family DNA binding protein